MRRPPTRPNPSAPSATTPSAVRSVAGAWGSCTRRGRTQWIGDLFGGSVALDGEWALVGAYYKSHAAENAGAAYIFSGPKGEEPQFVRGDCNGDGRADISDAVCVLNWLFVGEATPGCVAGTNVNGDEAVNVSDATYLLNHLFLGGLAPVEPFPNCGVGPLDSDEALGCETPTDACR